MVKMIGITIVYKYVIMFDIIGMTITIGQFYMFLILRLPVSFDPGILFPIAKRERKLTKSIMLGKVCEIINNRIISTGLKDWPK